MTPAEAVASVRYADIVEAAETIAGVAHLTPVVTSRQFDERAGCDVFFKCENQQRMGAFKFRGAYNALAHLSPDEASRGVVAFSSGNHAQAVALAAQLLGMRATIVMPDNAPRVKLEATRGYGAEVVQYDPKTESRTAVAERVRSERGAVLVPPFDHPQVIAGQGTAAKELIEAVGRLDYLFVCCGGAGLLSGCAVAATTLSPGIKVIGVEPAAGDDAAQSFHSRQLVTIKTPDTIADGARTESLGHYTFPLVMEYVSDIITVTDSELVATMFWVWERMKQVIEPTGALAAAGVLSGKINVSGKRVGVILSGGNVDLKAVARLL